MATHLVTGYAGVEHVAAADDATLHASMVGKGKYVFDSGSNFAYEVVSNNLIKIKDGDLMNQGRHIKIAANDYEELEIDNGIAGVKRYDLIVCRYNKDVDTSIESASLVVVKGTSSATPTDPTVKSGDIFGGDLVDDFPLYRVCLDGQEIADVDCLFEVAPNNVGIMAEIGKMKQAINQAAKTWIIPDDTIIDVFDIGEPGEKYPVSKYDGKLYLDVASGTVYACANEEWTVNATLTSVQDELETINSNLEYKPGDSFDIMGQFAAQANTNGVYFTIPLTKPVKSGASISVSAGNYTVITPSGYIAISAKDIVVYRVSENCIFCISHIGSQNNACCVVHGEFNITIS